MKTKTCFIQFLTILLIETLIFQCFNLPAFAEMRPEVKPGPVSNTVVWETSLKPVSGKNEILQIVCLKGTVNEDTYDKGRITGAEGKFELRLADADAESKVLSANKNLFDFDMEFNFTNLKIIFDDYNDDGYIDFALGQTIPSKPLGWVYKIYTVKDGEILELPVKEQQYVYISGGGYYSVQLDKSGSDCFDSIEYEEYNPKECVIKTYKWDGKQFTISDEITKALISDKNKNVEITHMSFWPKHGISLYTIDKPEKGKYKGYYLYVRGEENYYPYWTANYPLELRSIVKEIDGDIFAIYFNNGSGTSYADPTVLTFSTKSMSVIEPGPEYYYFCPPGNENTGQMAFSGGALADDRNTDMLLMINGELVSDIDMVVYGDVLVPLYQINEKLGVTLNQTKIDVKWQRFIDGVGYVSLSSVAEAISAEYGIMNKEFDRSKKIYPYELVWIDTQTKTQKPAYGQDKAVQYVKDKLNAAYEQYKPIAVDTFTAYKYSADMINESLDRLKAKIDGTECVGKISRYWVLEGPYLILVDEYTGDIYFQQWSVARTWIMKVDFSKPVSFDLGYFLN